MATPTLAPLHRYLVAIQIPDTSTPRVVEITAPNQQGVAAVLARSNLKYITPPIDLGPAAADTEAITTLTNEISNLRRDLAARVPDMTRNRFFREPMMTIGWGVFFGCIISILMSIIITGGLLFVFGVIGAAVHPNP